MGPGVILLGELCCYILVYLGLAYGLTALVPCSWNDLYDRWRFKGHGCQFHDMIDTTAYMIVRHFYIPEMHLYSGARSAVSRALLKHFQLSEVVDNLDVY
jgi:hypothetical protein